MAFQKIERLTGSQVHDLVKLYQNEWWSRDRCLADIQRMLENSDLLIGLCDPETQRLVAFARVLTDYVYKAFVFDVIVAPAHRGEGLGAALMEALTTHPVLASVQHLELYCLPEIAPFYRRWGFTHEIGALCFMRRIPTE